LCNKLSVVQYCKSKRLVWCLIWITCINILVYCLSVNDYPRDHSLLQKSFKQAC